MFQNKLLSHVKIKDINECPLQADSVSLVAALPTKAAVHQLAAQFGTSYETQSFLSFVGVNGLRFAGCLVTGRSINAPIAFCPISGDLVVGSAMWRSDVMRQLTIARTISQSPEQDYPAAITFRALKGGNRDVPAWLFALACVPISESWSGGLEYPIPFCPTRFGSMARQPQARSWLQKHSVAESVEDHPVAVFTPRERTVLRELCLASRSEKEIAVALKLSIHTIHIYIKNIYRKLGVTSRCELMGLFINRTTVDALVDP